MIEKAVKVCSNCETKYTITWDIGEQDLDPMNCPFCGHEVGEDDVEEQTKFDSWD